jgi:hypothetical protein
VDRNFHQIFSKIRDDDDYVCVDVDRNFHQIFSWKFLSTSSTQT